MNTQVMSIMKKRILLEKHEGGAPNLQGLYRTSVRAFSSASSLSSPLSRSFVVHFYRNHGLDSVVDTNGLKDTISTFRMRGKKNTRPFLVQLIRLSYFSLITSFILRTYSNRCETVNVPSRSLPSTSCSTDPVTHQKFSVNTVIESLLQNPKIPNHSFRTIPTNLTTYPSTSNKRTLVVQTCNPEIPVWTTLLSFELDLREDSLLRILPCLKMSR